jgi:hypothetical protein
VAKSLGWACIAFCVLQFLSDSFHPQGDSGNGGGVGRSLLDYQGTSGRINTTISHYRISGGIPFVLVMGMSDDNWDSLSKLYLSGEEWTSRAQYFRNRSKPNEGMGSTDSDVVIWPVGQPLNRGVWIPDRTGRFDPQIKFEKQSAANKLSYVFVVPACSS